MARGIHAPYRTAFAVAVALALAVSGLAAGTAAQAHPVSHSTPRILNLDPHPGAVVPAGDVAVRARVVADVAVERAELRSGGTTVPAALSGSDPTHPQVSGTLTLPAGDWMVELEAELADGQRVERRWRVHVSGLELDRIAGPNRVATAVALSETRLPEGDSAEVAFLARSDHYADSLAAAPLAAALDAPLLLTDRTSLDAPVAAELQRVLAPGGVVHLLGGSTALDRSVEDAVAALGFATERIAGPDRYATAAALTDLAPAPETAFVVSGLGFPDALAAAVPAGAGGHPILLTRPGGLHPEAADRLAALGTSRVYVVGGTKAVEPAVVNALDGIVDTVERLDGPDRYATAEAVAGAFFPDGDTVAVASGTAFPDALTGGPFAAARGAPLLTVPPGGLRGPQRERIERDLPGQAIVFGGTAAVASGSVQALHEAWAGSGGPHVTRLRPSGGATVYELDEIRVTADRPVERYHSPVMLTVNGQEALARVRQHDDRTIVVTPTELPRLAAGRTHDVVVRGSLYADGAFRAFEHRFRLRKLATFAPGDRGDDVRDLQRRLRRRGYWPGPIDGRYDTLVRQAVLAFQKAAGLPADGVFGQRTAEAFEEGRDRPRPRSRQGRVIEVDLERQLVMVFVNGRVDWVFHTSTGHGQWYTFQGTRYRATTSTGQRRITRQINGWRHAARGSLWRPKYFDDLRGIAIHGSSSVPTYPASAGCVRVSNPAMDFIWDEGLAPIGTTVWVYPEDHYD